MCHIEQLRGLWVCAPKNTENTVYSSITCVIHATHSGLYKMQRRSGSHEATNRRTSYGFRASLLSSIAHATSTCNKCMQWTQRVNGEVASTRRRFVSFVSEVASIQKHVEVVFTRQRFLCVRITGIEPIASVWKTENLPLIDIRDCSMQHAPQHSP